MHPCDVPGRQAQAVRSAWPPSIPTAALRFDMDMFIYEPALG